jgi:hypothetical protein
MEQEIAATSDKYLALADAESSEAFLETYNEDTEYNYRRRRRYMQAATEEEVAEPPNGVRQRVTFNNCLFSHNGPGPKGELTHYGVIQISTPYVELVVNNSIFMDNAFEGSTVVVSGKSC